MGVASASHAQGTAPSTGSSNNNSAPSQMTPVAAADAVPANKVTKQDLAAAFNRADGNHGGLISREEFNKAASN